MSNSKLFFGILLIIFVSYLTYYFYLGILHPIPLPGDSWDYHIPIAKTFLNGTFLHPNAFKLPQWYYPGSSEIFIAIFQTIKIPLTLSNILASIVITVALYFLGKTFKFEKYYALIFALSFSTLTVVTRWLNAISIDVWLAVFFVWVLIILEKLKPKNLDFILLGFSTGMLIGSKYTGIFYLLILLIFYFPKIRKNINVKRFIYFLIPFSIFGLFWYLRNLIYVSNPIYPMRILGLKGVDLFSDYVYKVSLNHPVDMFNAFFSEYKFWTFLPLFAIFFILFRNKFKLNHTNVKIFILGLVLFLIYFLNPTSSEPWIMVSSLRYSYPAIIILMLGAFMTIQKIKLENYLFLFITAISINSLTMIYYPKLILFYFPVSLIIYLLIENPQRIKRLFRSY